MFTPTSVLIRVGKTWSLVGTAALERDPATGLELLHLRLSAMAQDVYVPVGAAPLLVQDLEDDQTVEVAGVTIGHA